MSDKNLVDDIFTSEDPEFIIVAFDKEIKVKKSTIEETLGDTCITDIINNETISEEEKYDLISECLSRYICKIYKLDYKEGSAIVIGDYELKGLIKSIKSPYRFIKTPFGEIMLSGQDARLLKLSVLNAVMAMIYTIIVLNFNIHDSEISCILSLSLQVSLIYNIYKLIIRALYLSSNKSDITY